MISVAICTYNGEAYLARQLESILAQTRPVDEIVLCDDGSSDGTLAVARQVLAGTSVRWAIHRNSPGLGVVKNFQRAISLCRGDIVFTSDQDDVWKPEKVAVMMEAFEDPACLLAFSDADITAADGQTVTGRLWDSVYFTPARRAAFDAGNYMLLCGGNVVTGACMAVRRAFARECMPFPTDGFLHDDWLALCAASRGGLRPVSGRLIGYRQHGGNVVGVRRGGLWGKVCRWVSRLTDGKDRNRFDCLNRALRLEAWPGRRRPLPQGWLDFCRQRAALAQKGRPAAAAWVARRALAGDYRRFTALTVGCAARDFLMALLGTSPDSAGKDTP